MKNLLILLIFVISFESYSQGNDCGTIAKGLPIIFSEKQKDSLNVIMTVTQPYAVQIFVTVFANNDGSNRAASDADIRRQIQNMSNQYQPHNICFLLMGIQQVNNTDLNDQNITNSSATDESLEVLPFIVAGSLNIFIHNSLPGLAGIAYGIPNTYLSMSGGAIAQPQTGNITTLGHELGHCLGLYHTFEPWTDATGNPTKRENVARTGACENCTTNGDVLCDTPADDNGGVNSTCVYIGGGLDACNVVYAPMTSNMMGYGNRACRNTFTSGQGSRMRYFLINNSNLFSFLANDVLFLPSSPNSAISWTLGNQTYVARDFIGITQYANTTYDVSGSANQLIVSKKVSLKPGTRLHPSTGRVQITANPYCN